MSDNVVFEDYSVSVKNILKEKAIAFLKEIAGEIRSQAQRKSRRDTSQTAGSYQYEVDDSTLTAYIGSNEENAIWEEFGTGVHAMNGNGRPDPWYVPVDGYTGKKKPTYQGKVEVVTSKKTRKKFYKTDGKKANRTLYTAYNNTKPKAESYAKQKFGGI